MLARRRAMVEEVSASDAEPEEDGHAAGPAPAPTPPPKKPPKKLPTPRQPALRWMQLTQAPHALTLHLKRFRATGRTMEKIGVHVPFPMLLDAQPFCCGGEKPPTHADNLQMSRARPVRYELFGVVEHAGEGRRHARRAGRS